MIFAESLPFANTFFAAAKLPVSSVGLLTRFVVACLSTRSRSSGSCKTQSRQSYQKRVVASLYNRYCIRCHGADGRGVWDIPDVPNFTNAQWQACRSDGQLARIIIEGRGAVMPPFRGAMTLEEAWAMARYLRTFLPGTEATRPDLGSEETSRSKTGSSKKEK